LETISINFTSAEVSYTNKAHGRGSKRTQSTTTTNPVFDEGAIYSWEAPCCEDYWDSYEEGA
jgi:hypothetical protein